MPKNPEQPAARFRSAADFPKTIENVSSAEARQVYEEMRASLIFSNRSRAQLLRRNQEHKQSALTLKADVERLHGFINQLALEKHQLADNNQFIVSQLEQEMGKMSNHLNELTQVFDEVSDVQNESQTQWDFVTLPGRFFKFLRAVGAIVSWWKEENPTEEIKPASVPQLPTQASTEADRKARPQMHTDPASVNRSLLGD